MSTRRKERKSEHEVASQPHTTSEDVAPKWWMFFQCSKSPVMRSQFITALMAGTQLSVDAVPTFNLLDLVLLSSASRQHCEAEIVDDYETLLRKTQDIWTAPDFTSKVFDSIHACTASFICQRQELNGEEFNVPEVAYVPKLVEWYINHDVPEYFAKELTK